MIEAGVQLGNDPATSPEGFCLDDTEGRAIIETEEAINETTDGTSAGNLAAEVGFIHLASDEVEGDGLVFRTSEAGASGIATVEPVDSVFEFVEVKTGGLGDFAEVGDFQNIFHCCCGFRGLIFRTLLYYKGNAFI
nr:MAG TPA: hypothetical protein [Caudoviricetes sp.]